jgi:hypothetical protein
MAESVHCDRHGETPITYVCCHLATGDCAQGFVRDEPTDDNPFPSAWCNNCEIIRAQAGEWNDENGKLAQIKLLCTYCYNQSRIRNTIPDTTLDDLADLKWKCGSCDEWHYGPALDFGFEKPDYWSADHEKQHKRNRLLPTLGRKGKTWRNGDYAVCDNEHFFIRGIIRLPIIGTNEHFCWGVWGSLSKTNFLRLHAAEKEAEETKTPVRMFSWLSNSISDYPEADIKMQAHIQGGDLRPVFEIEHTNHPLAQEYHHGIHPRRVKEIMLNRLRSK